MPDIPSFEDYVSSLGRLTAHVDPTGPSADASEIKDAAHSLSVLDDISIDSLAVWVADHPKWVPALGLAVGLSREKLKNTLKDHFDSSAWQMLARKRANALITMLDEEYDVVRLVSVQRDRSYDFGDILVARAGTRLTATRAGVSGRKVEDDIEAITADLGLMCQTRTRFGGRNNRTAPCDLVIPHGDNAAIVVAAKAFDSTGSKLTDAVREIEEIADVRLPRQYIIAVIDGIGWKSRKADLRRRYDLWASEQIDGMYNLASLGQFRKDVEQAALLRGLL
ncbi:MAG: DpnII family type II restriction endonuclease [Pseudonocardiaceae bacterium]